MYPLKVIAKLQKVYYILDEWSRSFRLGVVREVCTKKGEIPVQF